MPQLSARNHPINLCQVVEAAGFFSATGMGSCNSPSRIYREGWMRGLRRGARGARKSVAAGPRLTLQSQHLFRVSEAGFEVLTLLQARSFGIAPRRGGSRLAALGDFGEALEFPGRHVAVRVPEGRVAIG